jgi:hypothetical protein
LKFLECVKEAVERVATVGRYQEQVSMGYPPATGVEGYHIGLENRHHPPGDYPGGVEQTGGLGFGQFVPPGHVPFGNDQTVTLAEGIDVQNRIAQVILENAVRWRSIRRNGAENTLGFHALAPVVVSSG